MRDISLMSLTRTVILRDQYPTPRPHYFLKALTPNTVTLGVRGSHRNLGGLHSAHSTFRMMGVGQVEGSQGWEGTPGKYSSEHRFKGLGRCSSEGGGDQSHTTDAGGYVERSAGQKVFNAF